MPSTDAPLPPVTIYAPPAFANFNRFDGTSAQSLSRFKTMAAAYLRRSKLSLEDQVDAFISGELLKGAPLKIIQRWYEAESKKSSPNLTVAAVWAQLEEKYDSEELKKHRRSAATAELRLRRFRDEAHRNESPLEFVESLQELCQRAGLDELSEEVQLRFCNDVLANNSSLSLHAYRDGFPTTFAGLATTIANYLALGEMLRRTDRPTSAIPRRDLLTTAPSKPQDSRGAEVPSATVSPKTEGNAPTRLLPRARPPEGAYRQGRIYSVEDFAADFETLSTGDSGQHVPSGEEVDAYYADRGNYDRGTTRAGPYYRPPGGPCGFVNADSGEVCQSEKHTRTDHIGYIRVCRDFGFHPPPSTGSSSSSAGAGKA